MQIAILVPSRQRIDKKNALIKSIKDTVDDIGNVTLYFGTDLDDPDREKTLEIVDSEQFIKSIDINNGGEFLHLGVLWNICAAASTEEIIAMIGDDMEFRTSGWDTKILEEFSESKCPSDNFKMVSCYDGRHKKAQAVNSFIHRAYMDLTGYYMREEFPMDGIDIWLQQIYVSFGRAVYRQDIHIEHKHWTFGKSEYDSVTDRMRGHGKKFDRVAAKLWKETVDERFKEAQIISDKLGIPFNPAKINDGLPNFW